MQILNETEAKFVMGAIVAIASNVTGVSVQAILSPMRVGRVVRARWAVMQIASKRYGLTLSQIGRYLGRRHHTTVLYGLREAGRLPEHGEFARLVLEINEKLAASKVTGRVAA